MKFEYIAKNPTESEVSRRVPGAGLEPARYCYQRILSPVARGRETCFLQYYIELFNRTIHFLKLCLKIYKMANI